MKFAYADPPYLGQGVKHYGDRHDDAADCDTLQWHRDLVERLEHEFPEGWALSLSAPSLRHILPLCPDRCRVGAWTKPFCSFKPGVNPAYCWEPVIWRGGRKYERRAPAVRDYCSVNVTLRKGFPGAKPAEFCFWLFALLGAGAGDEMCDLFPGSGAVSRAWAEWCRKDAFVASCETPSLFPGD